MTAPVPAPEPLPADVAAARNQRALVVAGVAAGLLLLFFLATRVLGSGGGGGATTPTTVPPPPGVVTTTTVVGAPVESFEVFSTKNPFTPARGAPVAGGTGPTPTTIGGPVSTNTTARGSTATTSTTLGTGSGGSAEPRRGEHVALLDVFTESGRMVANVRVNDTVYKVGEGDTFATSYKVVSLDGASRCGRFLFGDDQFRLCRGEEVVK